MAPRSEPRAGDPLDDIRRLLPVYAIDGDERVLVDEAVRLLKDLAVPPRARDFNLDSLDARTTPLARVVDTAQTLPAFAARRLVMVWHAEKLDLDGADALLAYLERPNPTTVLAFVASDKLDARTRVYKAIAKAGAAVRFARPSAAAMPAAIRARAAARGVKIEDRAAAMLADAVGTDLSAACQALEVLSLYVGPGKDRPIGRDDVAAVVSVTREESIFELVDAVGGQDRAGAHARLAAILADPEEHPLRVLAMLARHYRQLVKTRAALDHGAPRAELPRLVGAPPFAVDRLVAQARRQPLSALVEHLVRIAATDRELKGGRLRPAHALERLVSSLMRSGPAATAR